jgi:DNA repair exonuclease SbcCD ATPase subunit
MKQIRIDSVVIQNFKSFRHAEVKLPIGGFNFLGGRNEVEPQLGANGAGKSSFWDAIFWCLYGTDALGNRASDLTAIGQKKPVVGVCLQVDGSEHLVYREGNPNKLSMDADPCDQSAVDALLALNAQRFLNAVLFAQKGEQFYEMRAADRGLLMDSILDLGSWLALSDKAASEASVQERHIQAQRIELARAEASIPSAREREELEQAHADHARQMDDKLDAAIREVERLEAAIPDLASLAQREMDAAAKLQAQVDEFERQREKTIELMQPNSAAISELHRHLVGVIKRRDFFRQTHFCPTCTQEITRAKQREIGAQIADEEAEIREKMAPLISRLISRDEQLSKEHDALVEKRKAAQVKLLAGAPLLQEINLDLRDARRALDGALKIMGGLERDAEQNPISKLLAALAAKDQEARSNAKRFADGIAFAEAEKRHADYWKTGFKKVRLFLIKQALAFLTLETANAAQALGLIGWQIDYVTEVETKSGSMRAGIAIKISSPAGAIILTSGGESQRIRMAITIAIASMIQRMAGVDYGLEIWDEPTAHLSSEGIGDMLDCLRNRAGNTGKAVWIVDHQIQMHAGFDRSWVVVKSEQGSAIEKG